MVAEMRLRRDHGPRAGMVNSVSSSIRQADPLATRPPPSHSLSSPLKRLCTSPSSIYLSPSFHPSPSLHLSFSLHLRASCPSLALRHPSQNCTDVLELPNGNACLSKRRLCVTWLLISFFSQHTCEEAFPSFVRLNEVQSHCLTKSYSS